MAAPHTGSETNDIDCMTSKSDASSVTSNFDCSICLELSQDPVVTMCGHLFCWPCLHRWITMHSVFEECPVCKACVKDKVIPLYGRGKSGCISLKGKALGDSCTARHPVAHRTHVSTTPASPAVEYNGSNFRGNHIQGNTSSPLAFSVGFGLFPGLFGFHMINSPEHVNGFDSSMSYNGYCRFPGIDSMRSHHWRANSQQEFVLYWFLILLALFAIGCFLLF